ncbi:SIMPL domain-containing protein [Paludisphaera mucosa]|uniref:SIMPL domain-containing protein n=1 Tax=Paludisphaera mucosa TaxID=3030827 RepID=A0ABT6FL74_9BACT|nr:SIMPL domain-containing protein [Paludisphaera mucosa]MDG3008274.1 SIMPL domain-containing protein [Paludisphaera mucosa]
MKSIRAPWKVAAARPAAWIVLAAVAVAVAVAAPCPAAAQAPPDLGNIEGLTVVGKGVVKVKPTLAEIDLDVSASAELTGDAIVKFRDAKKRVRDAFAALKLADVVVDERGLLVDQKGAAFNPYMMDYGVQSKAKSEVQLSRKLVVRATKIQAMEEEAVLQLVGRLLDVAQDAGAHVGPPSNSAYMAYRYGMNSTTTLVRFVVEDYDKLQEEAFAKAAADARSRAERLARLNGLELGAVQAVREMTAPGNTSRSPYAYFYGEPPSQDDDTLPNRLETTKFQEVPIRVELLVRYAIRPKGAAKP